MTIEQLMGKKGYTAAEIEELKPLLSNARFRKDLEAELTQMEADMNEYDRWFKDEITPEHERLMKEREDALAEAAANKARFEAMRTAGMKRQADQQQQPTTSTATTPTTSAPQDTKKYVTEELFQESFEKVGEAIATAQDLTSDFMQLFPGQTFSLNQMRVEAKAARKPVRQYVEEKFNFAGKRAEIVAKAKSDEEAKIRQDERQKVLVEFGGSNPNLTPMAPSNSPFVIRKSTTETKQPWEKTPNELAKDRIQKAVQKAASRGELASV